MEDFLKGILFTSAGVILFAVVVSMKKKRNIHSLREVECPRCNEQFLIVTSGKDYVPCSNCSRIVETNPEPSVATDDDKKEKP
jgi:ribosomal protein S27E